MIVLDATTKSLEIVLAGAITTNQLPFVLSYVDLLSVDQSVSAVAPTDGVSNNGTAVTVLAAPAAGHTRTVKFISVENADTVAATLTLRYNNNGTFRTIVKITLQPGDNLVGP
jgi:hypothetical protein